MNILRLTLPRFLLVVCIITVAPRGADASSGDAALGLFGGLLLGRVLDQGRPQYPPPRQVIHAPQQAPATISPAPRLDTMVEQKLRKLQELRDRRLITDTEYATARQEILNSL